MADLKSILDAAAVPDDVRSSAWDAFYAAQNPDDFKKSFDSMNLPDEVKHDLWELKYNTQAPQITTVQPPVSRRDMTRGQVAIDQAKKVWEGVKSAFTQPEQPPGAATARKIGQPISDEERWGGAIPDLIRGVQSGAPTDENDAWAKSANSTGQTAAALASAEATRLAGPLSRGINNVTGKGGYAQGGMHPAVAALRTALNPDLNDDDLMTAGDELKAGESKLGQYVKNTDRVRDAAKTQFEQELMPNRRAIIDPQKDVVVPGSAAKLRQEKIAAIPADIRPGTPEYRQLVKQAALSVPKDLTIGELEKVNSSLNQQNRAFHQAGLGAALGKMESASGAMDIAAERATRDLMEQGMSQFGIGGAKALKDINRRIGILIKVEDANDAMKSQARLEGAQPKFRRLGKGPTVNENIADAMKNWPTTTRPAVPARLRATAGPARMLPSGVPGSKVASGIPNYTSVDEGPVPDTSGVSTSPAMPNPSGRPKLLAAHTGGPFATPETHTPPAPVVSGVEGEPAEYERFAGIRGKGPYAKPPAKGKPGQLPLQPTVEKTTGRPASKIMGENQTSLADIKANAPEEVPAGSTLEYKSRKLDGSDVYHYKTPDGRYVDSTTELDLTENNKTKAKNFRDYTPPPPRMKRKK